MSDKVNASVTELLEWAIPGVQREMRYAEKLHGPLPIHDPCRCLTILTEEVGELAEAILVATRPGANNGAEVMNELRQVAAVAIRWAGQLEKGNGGV